MKEIVLLTNGYFKDDKNYEELHSVLSGIDLPSRELPDLLTLTMNRLGTAQTRLVIQMPHWHHLMDDDCRSLRNFLAVRDTGKPKHKSRNDDLLQYLSLCSQYLDDEYAAYVRNWCRRQAMCLDDEEDDL